MIRLTNDKKFPSFNIKEKGTAMAQHFWDR